MSQKTPKLHELLAVESDLEGLSKKVVEEGIATLSKKPEHFIARLKKTSMFDASRTAEDKLEETEMVTTVPDKVGYVLRSLIRYYDCVAQKEATNQNARADLVVDGVVLVANCPATLLLGLESKLKTVRGVIEAIPTLEPGLTWMKDDSKGRHVYVTRVPEVKFKTEKVVDYNIVVPATDKFPAQIDKVSMDKNVGNITETKWSGMIHPSEKSDILERCDTMIQACKKARQRANATEVVDIKVGEAIMSYIMGGPLPKK